MMTTGHMGASLVDAMVVVGRFAAPGESQS